MAPSKYARKVEDNIGLGHRVEEQQRWPAKAVAANSRQSPQARISQKVSELSGRSASAALTDRLSQTGSYCMSPCMLACKLEFYSKVF